MCNVINASRMDWLFQKKMLVASSLAGNGVRISLCQMIGMNSKPACRDGMVTTVYPSAGF